MRVDLDPGSGVLRLDDAGFAALVAATAPGRPAPAAEVVPALAAVLADERWRVALEVVHGAMARLTLTVAGRDARLVHRGWVRPDGCTLLLAVRDEERQLVLQPPDFLAASLVRLTRIGPHRVDHARSPVPLDAWTRDHLTDPDPAVRQAALAAIGVAGAGLAWRLEVRAGDHEQDLTAVDGPAGIHVHLPDPGGDLLLPTTSTAVFRLLSALLPALADNLR
ncbi:MULTISPECIES: hypothetical protein [unclassified Nocardioides]|uniref:hypothetical protein n=1 Tax=unclassified Nocardioides TaxID=2615069 RepID=UPI00005701DC|nr:MULTISPECIES: hypothetical protein [unclassified Nocardioides]ABL83660.1 hypothetical protein Noca_4163 [Nocardioides sp. JS614]